MYHQFILRTQATPKQGLRPQLGSLLRPRDNTVYASRSQQELERTQESREEEEEVAFGCRLGICHPSWFQHGWRCPHNCPRSLTYNRHTLLFGMNPRPRISFPDRVVDPDHPFWSVYSPLPPRVHCPKLEYTDFSDWTSIIVWVTSSELTELSREESREKGRESAFKLHKCLVELEMRTSRDWGSETVSTINNLQFLINRIYEVRARLRILAAQHYRTYIHLRPRETTRERNLRIYSLLLRDGWLG